MLQETPVILADIAYKLLNASTDCAKLGLCPATQRTGLVGDVCDVCEKVVAFIDNEWFNNTQVLNSTAFPCYKSLTPAARRKTLSFKRSKPSATSCPNPSKCRAMLQQTRPPPRS